MLQKIKHFIRALYTLPLAVIRLYQAKQKADMFYNENPTRYYVLAASPNSLIVTSRTFQKRIRKRVLYTSYKTRRTSTATSTDMMKDCYYFTPDTSGRTPANYKRILREKFIMYIKHQLLFIKTRR